MEHTQQALHQSVFMTSVSTHPFRDLSLGREQHRKLLPGVADIRASEVARWTVDQVSGTALGPWDGPAQLPRVSLRHWLHYFKFKTHICRRREA